MRSPHSIIALEICNLNTVAAVPHGIHSINAYETVVHFYTRGQNE